MARGIAGDVGWQQFERDHPLQLQVACEPHFTHPANSQDRDELVVIDAIACRAGHFRRVYTVFGFRSSVYIVFGLRSAVFGLRATQSSVCWLRSPGGA